MNLNSAGPVFDAALRAAGLDPERLDPWPAWRAFKDFARQPAMAHGHAVHVVLGLWEDDDLLHMLFVRELALATEDNDLEAVREIVCNLAYEPVRALPDETVELSACDYADFDAFVAAVESHPTFQAMIARDPVGSTVTWMEV